MVKSVSHLSPNSGHKMLSKSVPIGSTDVFVKVALQPTYVNKVFQVLYQFPEVLRSSFNVDGCIVGESLASAFDTAKCYACYIFCESYFE